MNESTTPPHHPDLLIEYRLRRFYFHISGGWSHDSTPRGYYVFATPIRCMFAFNHDGSLDHVHGQLAQA